MAKERMLKICDVSHRDGSYLNGFMLNSKNTVDLVVCADKAGVDAIEVGHGFGVSGGSFTNMPGFLTDIEYCQIASDNIKQAAWGTFCIAEKCNKNDLSAVLKYQPDFIKLGCEPERFIQVVPTLRFVIDHSETEPVLFLMKSYAWTRASILRAIESSINLGVKAIYIVDSAGTMLVSEVSSIVIDVLQHFPNIEVGFHGHNNLGLAVANSVSAIENGATLIDCSLLGVGRSGGNCCLEQFIFVLWRMGLVVDIDVFYLLKFSRTILPNIYPLKHIEPLDIVLGGSGFHSAFVNIIAEIANRDSIDIDRLCYEIGKITKASPTAEELERAIATTVSLI